jgi:hypothetical protein
LLKTSKGETRERGWECSSNNNNNDEKIAVAMHFFFTDVDLFAQTAVS